MILLNTLSACSLALLLTEPAGNGTADRDKDRPAAREDHTPKPKHEQSDTPNAHCRTQHEPTLPFEFEHSANDSIPDFLDPVYLFSGEFYEPIEDMHLPGRGLDIIWSRRYASKSNRTTAMGNNWDHSYNIYLEQYGSDLLLYNGWGRADVYVYDPPTSSWIRPGVFRQITQGSGGGYTLTFSDQSSWWFHSFNAGSHGGKIDFAKDRNGNAVQFGYDSSGRINSIADPLSHRIDVTYNTSGFVQSLKDHTGRSVTYEYYDGIEAGGSWGDLKSATTPAVTGTPHGNDFPNGKTNTYTYTTGFFFADLDHNLVSIKDGKGQTYLINEYHTTTNPNDLNYDRIKRQTWGNSGDLLDLHYMWVAPSASNNFASVRVIVNDRMGHVKEAFYDNRNRAVMLREFAGTANPDLVTTDTSNRPQNPLRSDDPTYFETRWNYNSSDLVARITSPRGSEVYFTYDETNPNPTARGNLLKVRRQGPPGAGSPPFLEEIFEYGTSFGGGCCQNFVTKHTDARGNQTIHEYDSAGNRTKTIHRESSVVEEWEYNSFGQVTAHILPANGSGYRRRDETNYHTSGAGMGFVFQEILDATGMALVTLNQFDARGNHLQRTQPSGDTWDNVVNVLDQVVLELGPALVSSTGSTYRYETYYSYDANDNVVQVDIKNFDGDGNLSSNALLTTTLAYDILNAVVSEAREVNPTKTVTTTRAYDSNWNLALERNGESVNANDPFNAVLTVSDERDLPFQVIRGPASPFQSTTQFDYDENRNLEVQRSGLELTPLVRTWEYDEFDRIVQVTDPMGNVTILERDGNDNVVKRTVMGELADGPGGASNVRLSEISTVYDKLDRLTAEEALMFDPVTQAPILVGATPDGKAVTQHAYDGLSNRIATLNDNGNLMWDQFDTAGRLAIRTDSKGNMIGQLYDLDSNLMQVVEYAVRTAPALPEVFVSWIEYDALDRITAEIDPAGKRKERLYDSRYNIVRSVDERGNVTRFEFDGMSRPLSKELDLTDDGTGSGAVIGAIRTEQSWDDSSRRVTRMDDNGNVTRVTYDSLDRPAVVQYADGTNHMALFDVHDTPTQQWDANGNFVVSTFDSLRRLQSRQVTVGPGVDPDTTFENYFFDGASRLTAVSDDDSNVGFEYDSLGNLLKETIDGQVVSSVHDGLGNRLSMVYPSGRSIQRSYDPLERVATITEGSALIASYDYAGPDRVAQRLYGNGTQFDAIHDTGAPGETGAKRIVRSVHSNPGAGFFIDDLMLDWDAEDNLVRRADARAGSPGFTTDYEVDSANRTQRALVKDGGGGVQSDEQTSFDGVGNRSQVAGGIWPGLYSMSAATPEPADFQVNQYTATSFDAREYDRNGNLIKIIASCDGDTVAPCDTLLKYDFRNRLVEHRTSSGQITRYRYDGLARRIAKVSFGNTDGSAPIETRYLWDQFQVIEEQDMDGNELATYVFGVGIDEVLNMRRGGQDYYYHADTLGSVRAITDSGGGVVERYAYSEFGVPLNPNTLAPAGNPSSIGNPYLFTGRRYDVESGFLYLRARYLDPKAGRFISKDPAGTWLDPRSRGNATTYAANNPQSYFDPTGWTSRKCKICCAKSAKTFNSCVKAAWAAYDESVAGILKVFGIGAGGIGGGSLLDKIFKGAWKIGTVARSFGVGAFALITAMAIAGEVRESAVNDCKDACRKSRAVCQKIRWIVPYKDPEDPTIYAKVMFCKCPGNCLSFGRPR